MANPLLIRAGLKVAKKVGKKVIKKINTRANSTNNVNTGPIDRAINRTTKLRDSYEDNIGQTLLNLGKPKMSMQNKLEKADFNLYKLKQVKQMKTGKLPKALRQNKTKGYIKGFKKL